MRYLKQRSNVSSSVVIFFTVLKWQGNTNNIVTCLQAIFSFWVILCKTWRRHGVIKCPIILLPQLSWWSSFKNFRGLGLSATKWHPTLNKDTMCPQKNVKAFFFWYCPHKIRAKSPSAATNWSWTGLLRVLNWEDVYECEKVSNLWERN